MFSKSVWHRHCGEPLVTCLLFLTPYHLRTSTTFLCPVKLSIVSGVPVFIVFIIIHEFMMKQTNKLSGIPTITFLSKYRSLKFQRSVCFIIFLHLEYSSLHIFLFLKFRIFLSHGFNDRLHIILWILFVKRWTGKLWVCETVLRAKELNIYLYWQRGS